MYYFTGKQATWSKTWNLEWVLKQFESMEHHECQPVQYGKCSCWLGVLLGRNGHLFAVKTRKSRHSQECKNSRFVPRDLDIRPFDPKINLFPGLMAEHFCAKFGDPSCMGFWDIVHAKKDRQTDKRCWKPYSRDYRWRG